MENQSNFSKFVSIILIIGAVLGIISMYFALSAVHERANPKPAKTEGTSQTVIIDYSSSPNELMG